MDAENGRWRKCNPEGGWDKVSGTAKYTDDYLPAGILTAKPVTSRYAHANLKHIDRSTALALPGVKAVVTGEDFPF
jgi:CO/xanthine dehydrogenase Mo-binding subunit